MGYEGGEICLGTRKALAETPALLYQLCDCKLLARPLGASVFLVTQIIITKTIFENLKIKNKTPRYK